ncbi:MAG: SDR family oxidoreductase [Caldilineaceae bacterium]|nr:SDR family oxidoreductase [Caldilineaceae bacterium]MBP8107076.1 SDR family oxidoreductase [Caldilineaceae bacterium]MBP8125369.1 SDR family oxidoreductase [Caldilineaceae bacterium]MBP9072621.1 SDR family oxidoreductase [Caldilineaceae bacterium]
MRRLESKVALITGAASGIGRGIALKFAREGAKVGVLDLHHSAAQRVVDEIIAEGNQAVALGADISQEQPVADAVVSLQAAFGPITVLVNNAAVMPAGRLHETALADFDRCLAVNLRGTFLVSKAVIPGMMAARIGSIIHMASITGVLGLPGLAAYSATKGGLIALARAMSTDYARYGIRVNAVSPGTIDSPMLHEFLAQQSNPEQMRRAFDEMHPIGRVGTIDEVANVFLFLASDESSFVTGANYEVDGGSGVKGEQPQDRPDGSTT